MAKLVVKKKKKLKKTQEVGAQSQKPTKTQKETTSNKQKDALVDSLWSQFINSGKCSVKNELILKHFYFVLHDLISWIRTNVLSDISEASQINYETAKSYVNSIREDDFYLHERSNQKIEMLKALFHALLGGENPFKKIMLLKDSENKKIRPLKWDKICKICNNVDWETQALVLVGMYSGISLKNCVLLEWEDIDLDKNIMDFEKDKLIGSHGGRMTVDIIPDLKIAFENIEAKEKKGFVLPLASKMYLNNPDDIHKHIFKLFDLAEVVIYEDLTDSGANRESSNVIYDYSSFRKGYLENIEKGIRTVERKE